MAITLNNHVFKGHRALLGSRFVTYAEVELSVRYELFPTAKSFDWANTSDGARQLAFSMLCQLEGDELARKYATAFMNDIIRTLNSRDWIISASDVLEWIDKNTDKPQEEKPKAVNITTKKSKKPKSNVVKDICKELGITQKNLAEILEVPEGTVSSWAVKNEIPRLGKKAIEFYMLNVKNQKIVDSYRSFKELLEAS